MAKKAASKAKLDDFSLKFIDPNKIARRGRTAPDIIAQEIGADSADVTSEKAIGIPFPNQVLKLAFKCSGLLPRNYLFAGPPQSGKTCLARIFASWIINHCGEVYEAEIEHNFSPTQLADILQQDPYMLKRYKSSEDRLTYLEEGFDWVFEALGWYEMASLGVLETKYGFNSQTKQVQAEYARLGGIERAKKRLKENGIEPPGDFMIPLGIVIDSLGVTIRDTEAKSETKGGVVREAGRERAAALATLLPSLASRVSGGKPIWVFMTQHAPEKEEVRGQFVTRWVNIKGGNAVEFGPFGVIEVVKGTQIYGKTGNHLLRMNINVRKSKTGQTGEFLELDIVKRPHHDIPDKYVQVPLWAATLVRMLTDYKSRADYSKECREVYNALKKTVDLTIPGQGPGKKPKAVVWSDRLGIPESDPATFQEAGELIEADAALCAELDSIFQVTKIRPYFPAEAVSPPMGYRAYRTKIEEIFKKYGDDTPPQEVLRAIDYPHSFYTMTSEAETAKAVAEDPILVQAGEL
jgi:hypothetical protein